ncbi:hypothetical protein K3495_g291 [Podosphaera aphanis]|nr:hypothetical protein K3495_g291 [Podosphaera aphanis]
MAMEQDLEYLGDNLEKLRPGLQLTKVQESLPQDLDLGNRETWINNYLPPWGAKLPYKVEIGILDKEKEKVLHNQIVMESHKNSLGIYYTDAARSSEAKGIGVAFQLYDQVTHHSHGELFNIGLSNTVYDGELEAIVKAVEHAEKRPQLRYQVVVFSDIQGTLKRLKRANDKLGQAWVRRAIKASTGLKDRGTERSIA